ncbi:Adenylate kinase or related kinase (Adk) [Fructobacillus evanidus]|uniref:Adenylate kinase or related kinase (Adk) n=1 Tax=Fructobacillus evanidus TaxID=3064281 RepID=A0ABM9N2N3_9LACO|nr:Adenylate kinase or related kinase (Adk) [Fructobacillus sp. LMG 32999]
MYFEVPDQVLVDRLMNRGRADDTKDVIAHRLEVNKKANLPLVDYYENHGVLHTIDGNGELDRIYADVKSVLDALD